MTTAPPKPQPMFRTQGDMPPVERYTDERAAAFILDGATDAADYAAARLVVREDFGLDPDAIDHQPPPDAPPRRQAGGAAGQTA